MNFAPIWVAARLPYVRFRLWRQCALLFFAAVFSTTAVAVVSPTSITLTSNKSPLGFGEGTFVVVRVQGGTGASPRPTGTVAFADSLAGLICSGASLSAASGVNTSEAVCRIATTSVIGNHTINATYSGDSFYRATAADAIVQVIVPAYTATGVATVGGQVSPASHFFVQQGTGVGFLFTPNPGFRLMSVNTRGQTVAQPGCDGVAPGTVFPTIFPTRYNTSGLQNNCTVTGVFSNQYAVTFSTTTGGNVSPAGTQQVTYFGRASITVTPDPGYRLTNVSGCGIVFVGAPLITAPTTWTTTNIEDDCLVQAFFTARPGTSITAVAGTGGSISPSGLREIPQGSIPSYTVTPNAGFAIASVTGCGGTLAGSIYTVAPLTSPCTVTATFVASTVAPTTTPMIEYLHPALNYYFLTSRSNEIALLDAAPQFVRTGQSFPVYATSVAGTQPITRFYFDKVAVNQLRGSHFYTPVPSEVSGLLALNPGNSAAPGKPFNEGVDSYAFAPAVDGVGGSCAAGQTPVFRLFRGNVRFPDDPNHRFTTSTTIYNSFVAQGWDGEGVKLCVPQ